MHKCFPKASENGEPFSHFNALSLGEVCDSQSNGVRVGGSEYSKQ